MFSDSRDKTNSCDQLLNTWLAFKLKVYIRIFFFTFHPWYSLPNTIMIWLAFFCPELGDDLTSFWGKRLVLPGKVAIGYGLVYFPKNPGYVLRKGLPRHSYSKDGIGGSNPILRRGLDF